MGIENVQDYFDNVVTKRLETDPEGAKAIDAVFQFNITGDGGGDWVIDFKTPEVRGGAEDSADCTVTMGDSDFLGILNNTLNPMQAFMTGELVVEGNIADVMKLQDKSIFPRER